MRRVEALSLVEVLAALTLIAGTLAGLVMAQAGSVRQLAATRKSAEAHALAEALILQWKADSTQPEHEGTFNAEWRWTRDVQASGFAEDLLEVRLRVYGRDERGEQVWAEYVWLEAQNRDTRP